MVIGMADNMKTIAALQEIVTHLSQQSIGHRIQSRIFAAQGFSVLADKYAEHADEEMGYVIQAMDRILDLGGSIKNEAKPEMPVCENPIDWLKADLQVSIAGLKWLKDIVEAARDDYSTYDFLVTYYKDEEEDMYWAQGQLELIEKIGEQNWLARQL
jgi:bacterioferritin